MQSAKPTPATRPFERLLAILGAVICLVSTILLWAGISSHQSMWPLPGLYFMLVAVLGVLGAFTFIWGGSIGKFITWVAAGALLGFSILGAFSIGLFYLPAALLFFLISITCDVRNKGPILAHLAAWPGRRFGARRPGADAGSQVGRDVACNVSEQRL